MSFLGLSYALSQGLVSERLLRAFPRPKTRPVLLTVCFAGLTLGRVAVFAADDVKVVYLLFASGALFLGATNVILSTDASALVPSRATGALFGALESVECAAGVAGPWLGGALSALGDDENDLGYDVVRPLVAVVVCYALATCGVWFGYERYVIGGRYRAADDVASRAVALTATDKQTIADDDDDERATTATDAKLV